MAGLTQGYPGRYGDDMKLAPIFNPKARKPSPKPVKVDLRKVFLVGTCLWILALIVCILLSSANIISDRSVLVSASGVLIGIALLIWEHFDRWNYRRLGD